MALTSAAAAGTPPAPATSLPENTINGVIHLLHQLLSYPYNLSPKDVTSLLTTHTQNLSPLSLPTAASLLAGDGASSTAAVSAVSGAAYHQPSYLSEEKLKTTNCRSSPPNYVVVNKLVEEGRSKIWPAGSLEERVQNLVKTWEMELLHKANPEDYITVDAETIILVNGMLMSFGILHWGYREGPFKGHDPSGELVQFFGTAIFELGEHSKTVKVEFFFDRGELLAGLIKVKSSDGSTGCPFMS
ncbi:hypothetical protein BUALT_Bualt01G0016700 [Buddleja alternifolia]|uniref:Uncharacterized protein n=1 Tax=Buddleja alternifolia TaxID=168488 RepID=A0AAV6YEN1_9LAMI|nr:hypothetical protein BUALT_Bualt01G0016700 [Buddleja alternifolia]